MTSALSQRHPTLLTAAALVVVLAGTALALRHTAFSSKPPAAPPPPVQVTTAPVQQQDVPIYLAGIGNVTAMASVTVKARIDGQLERVGFTEGQDVKAGQMLARIDPRTLQAQLQQAQAQKLKDQAQLANARTDLQRYTTLITQDAATQQQLDTQKALVAQLDAAVKTDEAQINYAQVQLDFTTIAAPISGRVGARLVDPGNIVHAADANGLVVINQIDPIAVVFTLPEGAFQEINRALRASPQPLAVEAYPREGRELLGQGKLILLNNQIDPTTGTVQLKGSFPNPSHTLWPGQFVNARLVLGTRSQALTVPAAAVQRSQGGLYVYVANADGTAQSLPVQVARIQDGLAIIDKGLSAGQHVVVDGQYKLKPGVCVVEVAAGTLKTAGAAASGAGN
ncbi:efflux RND transporter periplasmic adaptor subunit [Variovorax terrae]|uniref:Efflux RND transporter periplasmic adaptor subunit n=1 Tax=Variovorax terrae TaxID=2923278 RepID=A0A9X1VRC7_9BURK|nr:efflux RND transporter periplasmic adaptor subunit [Variovorax terrae]MCJ0761923.1 efflux RND transporter periplasmic adaptor subunit [Variovorax terrae]